MDTITEHGLKGHLGMGAALQELRCLMLVIIGKSSKEAAQVLGIAPDTVNKRLLSLSTKWGVKRRTELVALAFRKGVVESVACLVLALLFGLQPAQQQPTLSRRPESQRRVELRVTARRHDCAWVA